MNDQALYREVSPNRVGGFVAFLVVGEDFYCGAQSCSPGSDVVSSPPLQGPLVSSPVVLPREPEALPRGSPRSI